MPTPEELERRAVTELPEGSPLQRLVANHRQRAEPDSREWWQEVAQGLGVRIHLLKQERGELLDVLLLAVRTIRTFHGLGMGSHESAAWELYQTSPEMKQINAALAKAAGRKEPTTA